MSPHALLTTTGYRSVPQGHHTAGDFATFAPGGYTLAALAAGGAIAATDAVLRGEVRNAYALVRPPGETWVKE